ncbi:MAG: alpha/beta hydrolase [Colwellia sp.]|nr:alpha/beta hydrolase [Colwellia sp.]
MRQKIYLIPGTMCNERLWADFLPFLVHAVGDNYEFIHVKIPIDKCFSQLSAYLNDYFTQEQVIIIGFSLGGYIASHFATTFPQRVDKVFVIANSPCILPITEEKQRQEIVEFVNCYGYKGMSNARAAQLFDSQQLLDNGNGSDEQLKEFINIMISMDAELGEVEFLSQMRCTSKRSDLFEQLASSTVQFVFYYSEHDALMNVTWLDKLEQASDNCVMICIQGASHMLPLEKPKELAGHVHTWLNAH